MEATKQTLMMHDQAETKPCYYKTANWIRIAAFFAFILLLILTAIHHNTLIAAFLHFIEWMEIHTIIGSLLFMLIFCISNVLLVPGSLLTLGAGFVYVHVYHLAKGVILASILVWFSACIGATCSFLNGRYLLRDIVAYYTDKSPRFALIERIVRQNGLKVVVILRLSPLVPYNIFNTFMGVTSVTLKDYVFAHPAMIPETIVFCFVGGSIAHIYQLTTGSIEGQTMIIAFTVIGTIIGIFGFVYMTKIARNEFNKLAEQLPDAEETEIELLVDNDKHEAAQHLNQTTNEQETL